LISGSIAIAIQPAGLPARGAWDAELPGPLEAPLGHEALASASAAGQPDSPSRRRDERRDRTSAFAIKGIADWTRRALRVDTGIDGRLISYFLR
jgi:hypothetical protein